MRGEVLAHNVLVFGRALRKLGLTIGTDHIGDFLRAMVRIGIERKTDVRAAGRSRCGIAVRGRFRALRNGGVARSAG